MAWTINQKKLTFKYEKEGRLYIGVAKIESFNGGIIDQRCPVFYYTGKKIGTIDGNKK